MTPDPFSEFRVSRASLFDAVTAPDGRGLTLTATDLAKFHGIAHAVIALANRHGWHVAVRHRVPGANVERLVLSPHR